MILLIKEFNKLNRISMRHYFSRERTLTHYIVHHEFFSESFCYASILFTKIIYSLFIKLNKKSFLKSFQHHNHQHFKQHLMTFRSFFSFQLIYYNRLDIENIFDSGLWLIKLINCTIINYFKKIKKRLIRLKGSSYLLSHLNQLVDLFIQFLHKHK